MITVLKDCLGYHTKMGDMDPIFEMSRYSASKIRRFPHFLLLLASKIHLNLIRDE